MNDRPREPLLPDDRSLPPDLFEVSSRAGELRTATLQRSEAVLRRRRTVRRALHVALLASVYVAGVASAGAWNPSAPGRESQPAQKLTDEELTNPVIEDESFDAALLEQLAERGSPRQRPVRLRQAGDRYLKDNDLRAALRCYAKYIGLVERDVASPRDSWLLAALRNDRN